MLHKMESCTGCGACVNACPSNCLKLQYDEWGFLQPKIKESECFDCSRCEDVCPVIHPIKRVNFAIPKCFAGWNKDAEIRRISTSGGVFSALAEYVLSLNGIVCGVVLGDELQPHHTIAVTIDEAKRLRGSKYLQSDTRTVFCEVQEALLSNKDVLFSGCPCQVAGLYSFLENKRIEKLLTCEVVCHGVPSRKVFDWDKQNWEKKMGSTIVNINFRSKKFGWDVSAQHFKFKNGKDKTVKAQNSMFMRAYYSSLCIRKSCVECIYAKLPRIADITIGDYWNAVFQNYTKSEIQQGISLILINNEKASNVISALQDKIVHESISIHDATAQNTNIAWLGKPNPQRSEFLAEYALSDIRYIRKKYFPITIKSYLASILGKRLTKKIKVFLNNLQRR